MIYQEPKAYSLSDIVCWALQSARALEFIHSKKHIHRDIKPQNLVLDKTFKILKICDFGLAREISSFANSIVGTPLYIAPEIYGERPYNEKCDVYSWALTIRECFQRKRPFSECKTRMDLDSKKAQKDYKFGDIENGEINELLQKCSAWMPAERYSMEYVRTKLEAFREQE